VQALTERGYRVVEVELQNHLSRDKKAEFQSKGLELILRFNSLQEAVDMQRKFTIDGVDIDLWHRGIYQCAICGQRGHK
jgi:negative regulator of genetic competence, sporulation and motility